MATKMKHVKDPDSVLSYSIDWSSESLPTGDSIVASTWIVPEGLTLTSSSFTTTSTTCWLSGGTRGARYKVVNRVVSAAGRRDDRTLTISVEDL